MDSFLNIALNAMRRQSAGYDAALLQRELDDFARPWRVIFGIWFAVILFSFCVIASSLLTGSAIWFGIGILVLAVAAPLPYLLQHHFLQNHLWNVVPPSLQPLETELVSFASGEREAVRPNGDIVERQLFRSSIAILLHSENRSDRFMVLLNPIRSYSTLLKATPLEEIADQSREMREPPVIEQPVIAAEFVRPSMTADRKLDRHWLFEIDLAFFLLRLELLASIWRSHETAGWVYVYTQAHRYFALHPHNPVHQCIADIFDAKKHPAVAEITKLPSDDTLKAALSRTPLKTYQKNRQHLEGKIDRTDFGHRDQIPLGY